MRIEAGKSPKWWEYRVYDRFDGREIKDCFMADEERMVVEVAKRHPKTGKFLERDDQIVRETRKCWCRILHTPDEPTIK